MEATLLTLGVLLILVGLIGQIKAKEIEVGTENTFVRIILGLIGVVFVAIALNTSIPFLSALTKTPTPKDTSTVSSIPSPSTMAAIISTSEPSTELPSKIFEIVTPTELPSTMFEIETPTIQKSPKVYDFQTCAALCNGQNSSKSFSEGIQKIYAQFNYENLQPGAKYERKWSMNGMEWIRYSCNWDGPISGTEILTLMETKGLHSGTWEITILVNDAVVLKEQITVNGNWNYWDPAGTINACHGTSN